MKFRLSLIYFAMFCFIAIHMPFWPLWLKAKGISTGGIAALTALSFALKIVFTPMISKIVDANGKKREAVILLTFGLFASCLVFFYTDSFIAIFVLTTLAFACWSPVMSLCESLTTLAAKQHQLDYGKIRLWGSISFMIVASCSGTLLRQFGDGVVLWAICAAALLLFISACLLPVIASPLGQKKKVSAKPFFQTSWFIWFLLATSIVQGSHAAYYAFGTIAWRTQGLSDQIIGLLWGASIAAEVLLFAFGRPLLQKLGAFNILLAGGVAAALRWALIGATGNVLLLFLAQALHAFSFGASHMAAIRIISDKVDDSLSATGQGLYSAFIMGIGMGIFILMSGPLYAHLQGGAFLVMALVALTGCAALLVMNAKDMSRIGGAVLPEVAEVVAADAVVAAKN